MVDTGDRDLYLSFFMFTVDLRPDDREYTTVIAARMHELRARGYSGFDLPIAPTDAPDRKREVDSYARLRQALDDAGLADVGLTTNVYVTRTYDPSSMYAEQRALGLSYLKSRVDITAALRASAMAGPVVLPYAVFPATDSGQQIWSDELQEWVIQRYRNAQPLLQELGEYAEERGVKVAIEPVDHWETPAPNMVGEVMDFLDGVASRQVGVCIDSAHVVLGSDGPTAFDRSVQRAAAQGRIHDVHLSAPDRGAVHDSWIPWRRFCEPVLDAYDGPLLVEVFNALPVFYTGLHLTRRRFWIPGEDAPEPGRPSAYDIAGEAIAAVRRELGAFAGTAGTR
jgi:sugar phosphate isomerase/epimerase